MGVGGFWMYFKAQLGTLWVFVWNYVEITRNRSRYHEQNWRLVWYNFQLFNVSHYCSQTTLCKDKHHTNLQPPYYFGVKQFFCPRHKCVLVWNDQINPRIKAEDLVEMQTEAGERVSLISLQRVIYNYSKFFKTQGCREKATNVLSPILESEIYCRDSFQAFICGQFSN